MFYCHTRKKYMNSIRKLNQSERQEVALFFSRKILCYCFCLVWEERMQTVSPSQSLIFYLSLELHSINSPSLSSWVNEPGDTTSEINLHTHYILRHLCVCFGTKTNSNIGVSRFCVCLRAGFPALWPQHGYHENSMTGDITAAVWHHR